MTITEQAQRRLIGTLTALDSVEDGTAGLLFGIQVNVPIARIAGQSELADVYAALGGLARADMDGIASAQRRLLEALAAVGSAGKSGMGRVLVAMQAGADSVRAGGSPELANVFEAVAGLAEAVQKDRKERV